MTLKSLDQLTGVCVPQPASLIAACGDYLVTLRIELDLADFTLVALEKCRAGSSENIIDAGHSVGGGSRELIAGVIESCVKHLIVMTAKGLNASSASNIPQLASLVNRSSQAILAGEVKLTAGEFTLMALKSVDALSSDYVPDLGRVVKGTRHDLVTLRVEVEGDNLSLMTIQAK